MNTSTFAKISLARGLSVLGFTRASLNMFDRIDSSSVSMAQLKRSLSLAKQIGDSERHLQYIERALGLFPENTFGYIEAASYWSGRGEPERAWTILSKAPKSRGVTAARHELESTSLTTDQLEALKLKKVTVAQAKETASTPKILDANQSKELVLPLESLEPEELKIIAERTKHTLRSNPLTWAAYELLARIWLTLKRHADSVRLLESMPKAVTRGLSYQLLLAKAYESDRDQISALRVMFGAQKNWPSQRQILMKIGDLYRADSQINLAHIFFKTAQACYPVYGTVRLLSFEADNGLFVDANKTLDKIAKFDSADLLKFMPVLNRVAVFFPERASEFAQWRSLTRQAIWNRPFRSPAHFTKLLEICIKCRWLSDARELVNQAQKKNHKVLSSKLNWLEQTENSLGLMTELLEIAYHNEQSDELIGIHDGLPMALDTNKIDPRKTVELFIPTVFFADPEEEKPSYETVRCFLKSTNSILLARKDLVIVPRHQYNWREVRRRLNTRALSYHTNSEPNPLWLHVQEAPLAGRCSTDHQGFAGYSSLASDFSTIIKETQGIAMSVLQSNQQEMYQQYVTGNVSKYTQSNVRRKISGKYVFLALQIPTDIVANLAWLKGQELLRAVADFYADSDTQVIVKRHPYCTSMGIQATIEDLVESKKIVVSNDSVHDLIEGAKIVFTVNSGVGLEALMHLKPVIVSGDCDYRFGVAAAVTSAEELFDVLRNPLPDFSERALQLLYYYRHFYTFSATSKKECRESVLTWLGVSAQEQAALDAQEQAALDAQEQAALDAQEQAALDSQEKAALDAQEKSELEDLPASRIQG